MIEVPTALAQIDVGRRSDFYFTLRSLMVHRQQDLAIFDEAFRVFWRPPAHEWTPKDLRAMGQRPVPQAATWLTPPEGRRSGTPQIDIPVSQPGKDDDGAVPRRAETIQRVAPLSYSAHEAVRTKDFAQLTSEELDQARAMIAALRWELGERRTRRWTRGARGLPDLRRIVRHNLRYGGEPFTLPRRERRLRRRPLVLLCDVSGSMERYSRMFLHFMHSLAGGLDDVEAFVFATHLTRLTRQLRRGSASDVLPAVTRQIADWGGGTRIGDALRAFNVGWGRRALRHGPVVLLISDGWDRGDPAIVSREMARLRRSCHRLIWLNPLLGAADYQPLTRGMQAALPFVDDFLPVHNLASLEALAAHLNALPPQRTRRARQGDLRASFARGILR
jgi:uncharacterized protein with von Willebrand factor type A (vWA) domain